MYYIVNLCDITYYRVVWWHVIAHSKMYGKNHYSIEIALGK